MCRTETGVGDGSKIALQAISHVGHSHWDVFLQIFPYQGSTQVLLTYFHHHHESITLKVLRQLV